MTESEVYQLIGYCTRVNQGMDKSAGIKETLLELARKVGGGGKDVAMKLVGSGKDVAKNLGTAIAKSPINTPLAKWVGLPTAVGAGIGGVKNWKDDKSVLKGMGIGGFIGGATGLGALVGKNIGGGFGALDKGLIEGSIKSYSNLAKEYLHSAIDSVRREAKLAEGIKGKLPKGFFDTRTVVDGKFIPWSSKLSFYRPSEVDIFIEARNAKFKALKDLKRLADATKVAERKGALIGGGILGGLGTLLARPFAKDKKDS